MKKQAVTVFTDKDIIYGYLDGHVYEEGVMLVDIDHTNYKYYEKIFIMKNNIKIIAYRKEE